MGNAVRRNAGVGSRKTPAPITGANGGGRRSGGAPGMEVAAPWSAVTGEAASARSSRRAGTVPGRTTTMPPPRATGYGTGTPSG